MDHVAQLNLAGPRDFLLQAEDELDAFVARLALSAADVAPGAACDDAVRGGGAGSVKEEPGLDSVKEEPGLAAAPVAEQPAAEEGLPGVKEEPRESPGVKEEPREGAPTGAAAASCDAAEVKRLVGSVPPGVEGQRELLFPALAQPYAELLATAARRYGLEARRAPDGGLAVSPPEGGAAWLPALGYADLLRPQRGGGPPPRRPSGLAAVLRERLRLRLWGLRPGAPGEEGGEEGGEELRRAVDAALQARTEQRMPSDGYRPGAGLAKRGRGATKGGTKLRHDYGRFGRAAPLYSLKWPWPSVKLLRARTPSVIWRPEWRVGPDVDDPPAPCPQRGFRGGVLSWALEAASFEDGEGFEVSLREGPGPPEEVSARRADAPAERSEEDFVLSFRRGQGAWHLTAGKRARLDGLTSKRIDDVAGRSSRHSFWVACVESVADGKHYVMAGSIPGILVAHFFVARVARAEPLSHAGLAYLPSPRLAAFGAGQPVEQDRPVLIESITVYPHGLTGELPFVSSRFLDAGPASTEEDATGVLARAPLPGAEGVEVRVLRGPAEGAERTAGWCVPALRECGLKFEAPKDPQKRAERAAKRARTAVQVARNPMEAPSSWEPQGAEEPRFGAFDDTLRHDPAKWAAMQEANGMGAAEAMEGVEA